MRNIKFTGFMATSEVSMTAALGQLRASAEVEAWGGVQSSAKVSIVAKRSFEGIAPEGIWFEAEVDEFDVGGPADGETFDPSYHEIFYFWSFGDPGQFQAPVNLPEAHADKNVAYGKTCGHVFNDPGTYTISVTAIDRQGNIATDSMEITVEDPDVAYQATRTVVLAKDGNFDGAPAGAIRLTDIGAAMSRLDNLGQTGRLLIKRGETHVYGGFRFQRADNCRISSWGDPNLPKPVLKLAEGGFAMIWVNGPINTDVVLEDLRFEGDWDVLTEQGDRTLSIFLTTANHYVLNRCEFSGNRIDLYPRFEQDNARLFTNECIFADWAEYAILAGSSSAEIVDTIACFTGNRFAQNSNMLQGGSRSIGVGNSQGPARLFYLQNVYFGSNDFFSNAGWSSNSGGMPAIQACIRISAVKTGDLVNIERNCFENGVSPLSIKETSAARAASNIMVDKNIFLGSSQTSRMIETTMPGWTIRNCLFILPASPVVGLFFEGFFKWEGNPGNAALSQTPNFIYNNTFVDLRSDAQNAGILRDIMYYPQGEDGITMTETNNILHRPNKTPALAPDAPLDAVAISGIYGPLAPRNTRGLLWNNIHVTPNVLVSDPSFRTPQESFAFYIPAEGSDALGDSTGDLTAYDDLLGRPRGIYPSRGAFEMLDTPA